MELKATIGFIGIPTLIYIPVVNINFKLLLLVEIEHCYGKAVTFEPYCLQKPTKPIN